MSNQTPDGDLLRLTASIVAAHVTGNSVPSDGLADLIRSVYVALSTADSPPEATEARQQPAVPIKKSVFPDYIVCLEDGQRLKMLKRHLMTDYNMTPDEYRARWRLPADYPMVAPNYAAIRSRLARQAGLGRNSQATPEPVATPVPVVDSAEPEIAGVVVQRIPERKRSRKTGSKNQVTDQLDLVPSSSQ